MEKGKTIAFFGVKGLPSQGGAERVVEALAYRSKEFGHKVTVYCRKDFTPDIFSVEGIELIRIPTISRGALGFLFYNLLSSIHCFLFGRYDIVHVHNVENCLALPILKLRHKVILTSHGKVYDTDKWPKLVKQVLKLYEVFFLSSADVVTCPSLALTQYYSSSLGGKVVHIPNGVEFVHSESETPSISCRAILDRYDLQNKAFLISATNRVLGTKGITDLIEAYVLSSIDIPLIMFGDWDNAKLDLEWLKKKCENRRVIFHSRVTGHTLWQVINESLVFIFPSFVRDYVNDAAGSSSNWCPYRIREYS